MLQAHARGVATVPLGSSALQGAKSGYALDLGPPGSDPLDRTARSKAMMTPTASTLDLAEGTARSASQRIPGAQV